MSTRVAKFPVSSTVTVLVGSKTGTVAMVESVAWSERDQCYYFYLVQPDRKLSRGYKSDELLAGVATLAAPST
jgi:hypothetical protein